MIRSSRILDADDARLEALEEHAFRYGRTYDSYLAIDADRQYFWSSDGKGVVAFIDRGRYLHAAGGLLAPDEHKPALLAEFLAFAQDRGSRPTFYNIADDDLPLFAGAHFQITKWGEEALVDVPGCTFEGRAFEWVRRQTNYCQRRGLAFSEAVRDQLPADQWNAILAEVIDLAPLVRKPQASEIRFLEGQLDPPRFGRKRLFLARDAAGQLEGFLLCNPLRGGSGWVFETYRHRPGGIRGTTTFLMHRALEVLQSEGVREVSMCLIPGLNCLQPRPGDSTLVRWAMVWGSRVSWVFDTAGLYHFKTRFRPRFESRYLCAYPGATLGSLGSFVRLLGVLDLSPSKLWLLRRAKRRRKLRSTVPGQGPKFALDQQS